MSFLTTVLSRLTPPPYENPVDYDGWEYKWRFLVFRPACKFYFSPLVQFLYFNFVSSVEERALSPWCSVFLCFLRTLGKDW